MAWKNCGSTRLENSLFIDRRRTTFAKSGETRDDEHETKKTTHTYKTSYRRRRGPKLKQQKKEQHPLSDFREGYTPPYIIDKMIYDCF